MHLTHNPSFITHNPAAEKHTFSSKERDAETGLSYFGARYYSSELSLWLSVDPMSGKYPSLSPYVYCADNPVKLVDPNGEEIEDPPYTGSGWGHSLRQSIAKCFKVNTKVNNIVEAGINSILQSEEIELAGHALDKVREDPKIFELETKYLNKAKSDPRYGKEDFKFNTSNAVQLGGKRSPEPMGEQLKDPFNPKYAATWEVAANELTWLVRSTNVTTEVIVLKNGSVTMNHSFIDVFDLRPGKGRSSEYNRITSFFGFLYHDLVGGNDKMKVKVTWTSTF